MNDKGFTLVEVLASLLIISLLLISFSYFFTQNNANANHNTEKLVTIYLADGYFEKLRVQKTKFDDIPLKATISLNNREYDVKIQKTQSEQEKRLNITAVTITVSSPYSKTNGVVDGYVEGE